MKTGRQEPGVAVLNNKIYVTGGWVTQYDDNSRSVECYDPDTNTWSKVANMNFARCQHALASLNGKLYAIGGLYWSGPGYGFTVMDDVEVYDPADDTWTCGYVDAIVDMDCLTFKDKFEDNRYQVGCCLMKKYYVENVIPIEIDCPPP